MTTTQAFALALAGALALPGIGLADPVDYPHEVVTLVTHSSPGGGSDVFLREMSKYLGKQINATFVVENVQGGSGAKAMAKLATAAPDGSIFYATTPTYIYTSLLSSPEHKYDAPAAGGKLLHQFRGDLHGRRQPLTRASATSSRTPRRAMANGAPPTRRRSSGRRPSS